MIFSRMLMLVGGCALLVGAAGEARGQSSLPPVKLFPSESGAATPPASGNAAPQPSQAGSYAQPQASAAAAPATAAGVSTPGASVQFSQARPGMPAAAPVTAPANVPQAGAAATDAAPVRRVSLGFGGPSAPSAPVAAAAAAPAAENLPVVASPRVAVPMTGKSSLPPPRLFGENGAEPAAAAPIAMPKASGVATRSRPAGKVKPVPPKGPEPVVIPAKPLLDEYGVQRIDPDGKPMFTAAVTQARDKHGKLVFADGKPVFPTAEDPGYDAHGKRLRVEKQSAPKVVHVTIEHGAFTVDGIVGKVQLNYDIGELRFLYLYVPDTGVTVVSPNPFPGAIRQRGAFRGNMLVVKTEEHALAVSSTEPFFGKQPVDAYVMVDRGFLMPGARFPVFGYGSTAREPYVWPGSKAEEKMTGVSDYAPPVPKSLKPKLVGECAPGQRCVDPGATGPLPVTAPAKDVLAVTPVAAPAAAASESAAPDNPAAPVMAPAADAAPESR